MSLCSNVKVYRFNLSNKLAHRHSATLVFEISSVNLNLLRFDEFRLKYLEGIIQRNVLENNCEELTNQIGSRILKICSKV